MCYRGRETAEAGYGMKAPDARCLAADYNVKALTYEDHAEIPAFLEELAASGP